MLSISANCSTESKKSTSFTSQHSGAAFRAGHSTDLIDQVSLEHELMVQVNQVGHAVQAYLVNPGGQLHQVDLEDLRLDQVDREDQGDL